MNWTDENSYIEGTLKTKVDSQVVSTDVLRLTERIYMITQLTLSFLGIVTNSINVRVFIKQGVSNSNTIIGLLALSVFDLCICCLSVPAACCKYFSYINDIANVRTCNTYVYYGLFVQIVFFYCSTWTTVYLSVERALCVLIPLKVKAIFKPKVTITTIVFIFVIFFMVQMTYSTNTYIGFKFYTDVNQTLPILLEKPLATQYLVYYSIIVNTGLTSVAIITVSIATVAMVKKLNQYKVWRMQNSATGSTKNAAEKSEDKPMSSKDAELIKSVIAVTTVFLTCLSASHIPATAILVVPDVSLSGFNSRLFRLIYMIRFMFNLTNSSINFFFYIRVSTRYREAFAAVFPGCVADKK